MYLFNVCVRELVGDRQLEHREEAFHPLELQFKVFCELPIGCWDQNSGLHARAAVVLIADVSLQPQMSHLLRCCYSLIEKCSVFWDPQHTFEH